MINKSIVLLAVFCYLVSCTPKGIQKIQSESFVRLTFDTIKNTKIQSGSIVGPCEPSIDINPINKDHIVAGAILNAVYVSNDGGQTWDISRLYSPYGVYGDPVVRFTNQGNPLYAHLSNPSAKPYASEDFLDRIVVQQSKNGGKTWSEGSFPHGDLRKDHDKQWMYVSPIDGTILMTWTEFDVYGSDSLHHKSRILFSQSIDEGVTWSDPLVISTIEGDCLDDDGTTEGAHPAVGKDGIYYVVWCLNSKIYLKYSKDRGMTWLNKEKEIAQQVGGWSYNVPGLKRCNGFPVLSCDHTEGVYSGRLYVNWSDQSQGEDDTDIWLMYSDDGGQNWSPRVRVNDDKDKKHQFLSWMDIDPITGYLYVVFYDRRHHNGTTNDVYLAYSTDGGQTFVNIKISEQSFESNDNVFFGDYNDISAYDGRIRPIWTVQNEGKLSVWTAIIDVIK